MDITEQIFRPKIKSVEYPNMQIMCTASIIPDTNFFDAKHIHESVVPYSCISYTSKTF